MQFSGSTFTYTEYLTPIANGNLPRASGGFCFSELYTNLKWLNVIYGI